MADLFETMRSPVLAMGVGSLGCRLASAAAMENDDPVKADWAAAHYDAVELIATGLERKLRFELTDSPFAAQTAASNLEQKEDELETLSESRSVCVLLGSLGETLTGAMLEALAARLRTDAYVIVVGIEPLPLEQSTRGGVTAQTVEHLAGAGDLFIRLSAATLTADLPPDCALAETYAALEKQALAVTHALIGACNAGEHGGAFKTAALRKILRGSGATQAGLGFASGANAACRALDNAAANLAATGAEMSGAAVALLLSAELKRAEAEAVFARLQDCAPQSVLGVAVHAHAAQPALCLLLARSAGSRKVLSISSALNQA